MKIPSKEELKKDLERLRDVSAKNESLTRQFSAGTEPPPDMQKQIQEYIKEQSRIVDKFVGLSTDHALIEKFQIIVKQIENDTTQLENSANKEEISLLKEKILKGIEDWIKCLEEIIIAVIREAEN